MTATRLPLLAGGASLALLALSLSPLAVGGATGGDLPIHHSDVEAIIDALRAGDPHLWLMNAGAGHPAGLTAPLLPPLLVALTSLLTGMASSASLSLWLVIGLVGTPIAVAIGAVLSGLDRGRAAAVGTATALLTSTSPWGLGPAPALYAGLLSQVVAGIAWPVALGATIGALRGFIRPGSAVVATVVAAAAHPMSALLVAVGAGVVVAGDLLARRRPPVARVARLVVGGMVGGLGILGPGLVGARHWGGFEQRVVGDHGDADVVGLLLRGLLTDYERAPILLLCAIATIVMALHPRTRSLRPTVLFALGLATVAAALIAAGPWLPLLVPWGRFLCLLQLGVALLAGLAPDLLLDVLGGWPRRRRALVCGGVVGGALVMAASGLVRHTSALAARPAPVDAALLAAEREALAPLRLQHPHPRVAALPLESVSALELTRPFVEDRLPALFVLGGPAYQSSPLRGVTTDLDRRHARLLHVGAVLSRDRDGKATVTLTEAGSLCEGFPVAARVGEGEPEWERAVQRWLDGAAGGALVQAGDNVDVGANAHLTPGAVHAAGSRIDAVVDVVDGPALLVCKVGFHPWWRATIDDRTAPVIVASPRFLAVVVPDGHHEVHLRFVRPWWLWLLWLGLPLGWLVAGRRPGTLT